MKLQNLATNAHQSSVPEEKDKKVPTLDEIHRRALEIHVRRGAHGWELDDYLDDWLQAQRELQEKYNKSNGEGAKEQ